MTTTVQNLGDVHVAFTSVLIQPEKFVVTRVGTKGPSVWRDFGHPIITTLEEMEQHVPADMLGDPFWGRGAIVDGDKKKKFISSNDTQAFHTYLPVSATEKKPRTFHMRVGDASDVDKTGSTFTWDEGDDEVSITIPFGPSGRMFTFKVTTTKRRLRFGVDSGTITSINPLRGPADGVAISIPCLAAA